MATIAFDDELITRDPAAAAPLRITTAEPTALAVTSARYRVAAAGGGEVVFDAPGGAGQAIDLRRVVAQFLDRAWPRELAGNFADEAGAHATLVASVDELTTAGVPAETTVTAQAISATAYVFDAAAPAARIAPGIACAPWTELTLPRDHPAPMHLTAYSPPGGGDPTVIVRYRDADGRIVGPSPSRRLTPGVPVAVDVSTRWLPVGAETADVSLLGELRRIRYVEACAPPGEEPAVVAYRDRLGGWVPFAFDRVAASPSSAAARRISVRPSRTPLGLVSARGGDGAPTLRLRLARAGRLRPGERAAYRALLESDALALWRDGRYLACDLAGATEASGETAAGVSIDVTCYVD